MITELFLQSGGRGSTPRVPRRVDKTGVETAVKLWMAVMTMIDVSAGLVLTEKLSNLLSTSTTATIS